MFTSWQVHSGILSDIRERVYY